MRLWYLRRAVPWAAQLGCLAVAVGVTGLVNGWPEVAVVALPLLVAGCGAAAAFGFDEPAVAIAAVTPRTGWWRGSARLLAALPPLACVVVLLSTVPDEVRLDRGGWWLIGIALVLLAVAPAAWAARRQVARPGGGVASAVVVVAIAPVVVTMMLGWDPIYPFGEFPARVAAFWACAALAGAVGCMVAVARLGRTARPWKSRDARHVGT